MAAPQYTNILALPLATMTVLTGTNEDWVDAIVFLIDSTDPVTGVQLDLRGINFDMEIRRRPPDHQVILTASTRDGRLSIGTTPDHGYLIINVPLEDVKSQKPDEYVGDIVASDSLYTRRCITFTLNLVHGVTR